MTSIAAYMFCFVALSMLFGGIVGILAIWISERQSVTVRPNVRTR